MMTMTVTMIAMTMTMTMTMMPECGGITGVVDTGGNGGINCAANLKLSHQHPRHLWHHLCHHCHRNHHQHRHRHLCELEILIWVDGFGQRINRVSVVLDRLQQPSKMEMLSYC